MMKFKPSEALTTLTQPLETIEERRKRLKSILRKKKEAVPLVTVCLSPAEHMKHAFIDDIYFITSEPSSFHRLAALFKILGHSQNFEDTCYLLGCYSFNDYLRMNRHYFADFLEIYVIKTTKKNPDGTTSPEFVLTYYNKKIQQEQLVTNAMLEAINDVVKPDPHRFIINFDETKYFDVQNSLEYIDGRKNFVKAVAECQSQQLINRNTGFVPMHKFQQMCQKIYEEGWSALAKTWFPKCGTLENIMRKIIFEDITCIFSSQEEKIENEFRLKDGYTFDEICQNLDCLKEDVTQFYEKMDRFFTVNEQATANSRSCFNFPGRGRPEDFGYRVPKKSAKISHVEEEDAGCFVESDDEVDLRVENAAFSVVRPRSDVKNDDANSNKHGKQKEVVILKEYKDFCEKYNFVPDYDFDEFEPELKGIDNGKEMVKQDLKEEIEEEKNENVEENIV